MPTPTPTPPPAIWAGTGPEFVRHPAPIIAWRCHLVDAKNARKELAGTFTPGLGADRFRRSSYRVKLAGSRDKALEVESATYDPESVDSLTSVMSVDGEERLFTLSKATDGGVVRTTAVGRLETMHDHSPLLSVHSAGICEISEIGEAAP